MWYRTESSRRGFQSLLNVTPLSYSHMQDVVYCSILRHLRVKVRQAALQLTEVRWQLQPCLGMSAIALLRCTWEGLC